jgi:nitronate monooxygenase
MFLASGPDLVIAVCKAGLIGTFPTLNQRSAQGWIESSAKVVRQG